VNFTDWFHQQILAGKLYAADEFAARATWDAMADIRADAALTALLFRTCKDMGAAKFDNNNNPGQIRLVLDVTNVSGADLQGKMRAMVDAFAQRVEI
jgi:hypothetical protein